MNNGKSRITDGNVGTEPVLSLENGHVSTNKEEKQTEAKIKNKSYVLFFIFGFITLITVFGLGLLIFNEKVYGTYWNKIIDFSSNVVLMLVGFFVGKKSDENNKNNIT